MKNYCKPSFYLRAFYHDIHKTPRFCPLHAYYTQNQAQYRNLSRAIIKHCEVVPGYLKGITKLKWHIRRRFVKVQRTCLKLIDPYLQLYSEENNDENSVRSAGTLISTELSLKVMKVLTSGECIANMIMLHHSWFKQCGQHKSFYHQCHTRDTTRFPHWFRVHNFFSKQC